MKTRIGVYGSLLSGLGNHEVIGRHIKNGDAELVGKTRIKGFKLYPVAGTSFPGINKASENDTVVVELYDVEDNALADVRMLEGYVPGGNNTFYDEVDAVTEEGDTAKVYLYVSDVSRSMLPIPNGDWKDFLNKVE